MNSKTLGANTSVVEVTYIDSKGFWLFEDHKEHFLPFDQFPWFADASVKQISHVQKQAGDHFHWPDLDVDLTLDMIDHPEKYPRRYRS
jgi:hypothetical protein